MGHIARREGRFLSVLPRTRSEDGQFRERVRHGEVTWKVIHEKQDDEGTVADGAAGTGVMVSTSVARLP